MVKAGMLVDIICSQQQTETSQLFTTTKCFSINISISDEKTLIRGKQKNRFQISKQLTAIIISKWPQDAIVIYCKNKLEHKFISKCRFTTKVNISISDEKLYNSWVDLIDSNYDACR